jgi:hypothetical protein
MTARATGSNESAGDLGDSVSLLVDTSTGVLECACRSTE